MTSASPPGRSTHSSTPGSYVSVAHRPPCNARTDDRIQYLVDLATSPGRNAHARAGPPGPRAISRRNASDTALDGASVQPRNRHRSHGHHELVDRLRPRLQELQRQQVPKVTPEDLPTFSISLAISRRPPVTSPLRRQRHRPTSQRQPVRTSTRRRHPPINTRSNLTAPSHVRAHSLNNAVDGSIVGEPPPPSTASRRRSRRDWCDEWSTPPRRRCRRRVHVAHGVSGGEPRDHRVVARGTGEPAARLAGSLTPPS